MYSIGIFTKYKKKNNLFNSYHNSNCKIYKIIYELEKIINFNYSVNNYSKKYDFAICDRVKPKKKIYSKYILNYSEKSPGARWATHGCTTTIGAKANKEGQFYLLNYCQGVMLNEKDLLKKSNKAVFLGRVTSEIEKKIIFLSKHIYIDIFPIKYWHNGNVLRFASHNSFGNKNIKFLQKKMNSSGTKHIVVKKPHSHEFLYKTLNKGGYKVGFVPSIYGFESNKRQTESSSKFFEYIGCGIPVLIEHTVPESYFVRANPFLGEIYYDKEDLIRKIKKMKSKKYNYVKILKYANKNHFPDSRAKTLYNKFILDGEKCG